MTPEQFDTALEELGIKAADFCRRTGLVPNTVWRWRKAITPIPDWVPEYLGALLEVKLLRAALDLERLAGVLADVRQPGAGVAGEGAESQAEGLETTSSGALTG
ncbi:hypothetical protein [Roseateles paludis]|jgi:hypothetical protein|uniref:XRE family transcriptional regulator n=1 Tax=Roseateles paludis TaxID=3145238 RepID=A0ABV0G3V4_9BURK